MRIDHLVWYCSDLAEGEQYFTEIMERRPAYGGVHPGEGTRNCLLSLAEMTYLEILGRDPEQSEANIDSELRQLIGPGLYHWAVGGVDLQSVRDAALSAGLEGSDVVTGGRTLPNGKWLSWSLFGLKHHGFGALVPFFIDWGTSEHPAKSAPRGSSLVKVEVFSPDAEELGRIYRALGIELSVSEGVSPGMNVTLSSRSRTHTVRMFEPVPRGFVI